mgnify:CR=1 FL=1
MKEKVANEIIQIAIYMNEEDRGKKILTIVLNLAHDDTDEENRIVAVELLSKLANTFGRDLCEQFAAFEFLSLGYDMSQKVRKEIIKNLPEVSGVVSIEFFKDRLLPFFMKFKIF